MTEKTTEAAPKAEAPYRNADGQRRPGTRVIQPNDDEAKETEAVHKFANQVDDKKSAKKKTK